MNSSDFNIDSIKKSRVLILSQRNSIDQVANSCLYDFEDLVGEFENADLVAPKPSVYISRKLSRAREFLGKAIEIERVIAPLAHQFTLEKEYDLLFLVVDNAWQTITINSIENWKKKCRKIVCYIGEIWDVEVEKWRIIKDLQKFDCIFLAVNQSREKLANLVQRPCIYLPPAINTIQFCNYPESTRRSIDITYIGRRSPIAHKSILEYTVAKNRFYYYDTAINMRIKNHREHRSLYTNLLKRSRYFIANYAKIDLFHETSGIQEIGYRFFEGIAAGTVMLGQPPASKVFQEYFDWEDAIVPMPVDVENVGEIIDELDRQPERLEAIRRNNTINALLRHDWVYRWKTVLETMGMSATPEMVLRENYLRDLAESIRQDTKIKNSTNVVFS
jgi:hypothetical protein